MCCAFFSDRKNFCSSSDSEIDTFEEESKQDSDSIDSDNEYVKSSNYSRIKEVNTSKRLKIFFSVFFITNAGSFTNFSYFYY